MLRKRFGKLGVYELRSRLTAEEVAAFEAADYLMDYLKSRAPFWKKEFGTDGAEWVVSNDEDEAALHRWRD